MNTHSQRWMALGGIVLLAAVLAGALFVWRRHVTPIKSDPIASRPSPDPVSPVTMILTDTSGPSPVSVADLSAALDRALLEQDPRKRAIEFGRLLALWVGQNPEAALDYVRKMPQGAEYTEGLFIVLEALGRSDSKRALTLARDLATTHEQRHIYSVLFDQIARRDVQGGLSLLELAPAGEARENALRALARHWAESDMTAVLNWAEKLSDAGERTVALETALDTLTRTDPRRTLEVAQQFLTGIALDRIMAGSLKQLTADDPQAAAQVVAQLPAGLVQTHAALDVVRALAAQDPQSALSWIKTLPGGEVQQLALNNVLDLWSGKNPADAGQYVAQMPGGPDQDAAAVHLAKDLAAANPSGAIRWAEGLESDSARNVALVSIASGWAEQDPAAATQWASTLAADSPARTKAMKDALSYWVMADASAAGSFVQGLPEVDQPSAIMVVAPTLAQNDPASALDWAQTISDPDVREIALQQVVTRWADNQPQEAALWVMTEPEGMMRVDHVRTVAEQWLAGDAESATAWVQGLPPGTTRDAASDAVANQLTPNDPALAVSWAESIGAPELRSARLEEVATAWLKTDPAAARNWLATVNLPAETKSRLLGQ